MIADEIGIKSVLDELHDLLECITGGEIHGLDEVQATSPLGEVLRDLMVRFQRREEQLNELRTEVKRLRAALTTISDNNAGCCEGSALEECSECYQLADRLTIVARDTLAVDTGF